MRRILLWALALVLILTACTSNGSNTDTDADAAAADSGVHQEASVSYNQITTEEAIQMMEDESDYIIVDVRRPDEFAEGHIKGAVNVPNETIADEAETALPDKDQLLFIYCRTGNRSKQASQVLADLGYTKVYEFGGIVDWPGETEK